MPYAHAHTIARDSLILDPNKHVADVMLDLALEEGLDTEFQLMTRSNEEETQIADMVKSGHALPTQSDAGARWRRRRRIS